MVSHAHLFLPTSQAAFGSRVAFMVAQVSKLSQMNQLLRRGKRKGWAEYSPQHFKTLRKMIVDMVRGWRTIMPLGITWRAIT
jgi:(p)ppGpp synthase/HD superfamily hydrolase